MIAKLEEIMESIRGAAEFDAKHEVEAESNFGAMLNELGGLREKLGTEQQKISTQLKSKNNDLVCRRSRGRQPAREDRRSCRRTWRTRSCCCRQTDCRRNWWNRTTTRAA